MPEGGLDFETWYAGTSARMAKEKAKQAELEDAAAASRVERQGKDRVAFLGWSTEVSIHDRALELIPQLSSGRFSDDESWKATALLLAYIEISIMERHKAQGSDPHVHPARTMEHMFASASKKQHSFDSVTISANLAKRFSKQARGGFEEADGNFVIQGLGYTFMQRAVESSQVRPMTTDQKLMNGIFSSMIKKVWAKAVEDAQAALDADGGPYAPDNSKRMNVSLARGLHKLAGQVQEDIDAVENKKRSDEASKRDAGRGGHATWLGHKDKMRIKLPDPETDTWQEPPYTRMDCTAPKGTSFRRVKDTYKPMLQTAADMGRSMGVALKTGYAYALTGNMADLERSRKKLIQDGFVFLENFADPETGEITEESREKYRETLRMVAERKAKEDREKRDRDAAAFHSWVETKEGAELARECMSIMPVVLTFDDPAQTASADKDAGGAVGTGVDARSVTTGKDAAKTGVDKPLLGRAPTEDEYELWRAVGYACKAVDRALLPDWMRWSAPLFSKHDCISEWSGFKPANHEADMVSHRAKVAEEERKAQEKKEAEDRALGIKPRAKIEGPPTPGGSVDLSNLYKPPKAPEPENWTHDDRKRALQLLHLLSVEHRKIHKFRQTAKNEQPPALPFLRRRQAAEALPVYLHGHEGAVKRIEKDLAMAEGKGLGMLGSTGVGAELVVTWFVGEDDVDDGPVLGLKALLESRAASRAASVAPPKEERDAMDYEDDTDMAGDSKLPDMGMDGTGVEGAAKLMARLQSAAAGGEAALPKVVSHADGPAEYQQDGGKSYDGPYQPPYVVVLETCGISGGRKQRDGEWTRVMIDPPEAMPVLTSTPGSSYVPLSAKAQGLGVIPPLPGKKWAQDVEKNAQRLRGGIRITGLLPNTSYAFRIRAYSRAGASPYAFGVFTTASAPPPAPIIALPSLIPRHLLSVAAAGLPGEASTELSSPPCDVDAITICWERRIDLRTGLLHLLRLFYVCAAQSGVSGGPEGRRGPGFTSGQSSRAGSLGGYEEDNHNRSGPGSAVGSDIEEEGPATGAGAMPPRPESARPPLPGAANNGDVTTQLFTNARVARSALLMGIQLEVGMRNWLASCIASVDFWPKAENASMPADFADSASSFRKLPARFKIALTRPCSVLEVLVRDTRATLSWDDITAMFEADAEADDAFDLMLAGTSVGAALGLGDATGAGAVGGTHKEERPNFSLSAGGKSVLSVQRNQLRKSMTISRSDAASFKAAKEARPSTAGSTSSTAIVPRTLGGLPPRPGTAGSAGGELTAQLALMRTKRRGSLSAQSLSSLSSSAAKSLAASLALAKPSGDVTIKYSLLQCISDGPRGQEWQEVFVGIRSMRRVDKLLTGTSYCFKVQAINQDGQGSLFGPPAIVTTALTAPAGLRVSGRVNSTSVALQWEEVSSANALTTMRAMGGGGGSASAGDKDGEEGGDVNKGADIDAVLKALLDKTKAPKESKKGEDGKDEDVFSSALASIAIREGDGGVGVDLMRTWSRYDKDGSGVIPSTHLRGLLADLGAYSETAALVNAALNPSQVMAVASGEGAASAGPGDWRLHAALNVLDPKGTGSVAFSEFTDWWNAVDAALAKARGVSLQDQLEAKARAAERAQEAQFRPGSGASLRTTTTMGAAVGAMSGLQGNLRGVLGNGVTVGDLSFAIVYVVEVRRLLSKDEAAAVAAGSPVPHALSHSLAAVHTTPSNTPKVQVPGSAGADMVEEDAALNQVLDATTRSANAKPVSAPSPGGFGSTGGSSSPSVHAPTPEEVLRAPLYTAWAVAYIGPSKEHRLHDLLPNGEYQFRVSALGRHAYSSPSKAVTVNLPPLSPFAPVVIKTDPRGVAVRWYPGELGADKFEVQVKLVDTLRQGHARPEAPGNTSVNFATGAAALGSTTGLVALTANGIPYKGRNVSETGARRLATSRALVHQLAGQHTPAHYGEHHGEDEQELWQERPEETWASLYTGKSTTACITGLYASAVYHMRVVAYNAAGVPSAPSPETQVVTPSNGTGFDTITVHNAASKFVVECVPAAMSVPNAAGQHVPTGQQDVVVGDTILFTEDVFVDSGPQTDPYHPAAPKEVPDSHPRASFFCSRTIAARVIADSASHVSAGNGHSAGIGLSGGPVPVGNTATQFNVAGFLKGMETQKVKTSTGREVVSVRPASASARRKADAAGGATDSGVRHLGPATDLSAAMASRQLMLQVEFCTVSKATARAADLTYPQGAIVNRQASVLSRYDMYRCLWEDEAGRWSLAEEMSASYDM